MSDKPLKAIDIIVSTSRPVLLQRAIFFNNVSFEYPKGLQLKLSWQQGRKKIENSAEIHNGGRNPYFLLGGLTYLLVFAKNEGKLRKRFIFCKKNKM